MKQLTKALAAMVVVAVVTPLASAGVMLASYLFLPLPANLPDRHVADNSQLTRVYDAEGNEIAVFRTFETSIPVKPEDIPQVVKDAVIAAEDRNFYKHGGVDFRGTMRALIADIRHGEAVQGGSTITQQLVKNSYTGEKDRSITRKVREAVLASQLDRSTPKEDILFQYLSDIYLGEGAYGVGAAAETYFRKPVHELDASEAALLAGLIPAPSRYSPRVNPEVAEERRQQVLRTMLNLKKISQGEFDLQMARPVWLQANGEPPGPSTIVWPAESQNSTHPYFTDYVRIFLEKNLPGGRDQLFTGGLRINTTLQPEAQFLATNAVTEKLDGTAPFTDGDGVVHTLQMSVVSVDPSTGYVRALVGGRDFATQQVNLALGADGGGSGRQPGSSFKPFVLATAFEQGLTPDKVYSGAPHTVGDKTFGNYGGGSYGSMTLRSGTQKSVNTVFTRLIEDVGVEETFEVANRLGLKLKPYDPAFDGSGIQLALGSREVSPLGMASAYSAFAFRGMWQEPTPVTEVFDAKGEKILDFTGREDGEDASRVLKEEVADNVTDVLEGVLTRGTAAGKGIGRPAAGKTGTASDNKDAWFVGYTPAVSTAVWMGYDPPAELHNIKGVGTVTGGSHPAQVWHDYMQELLKDEPKVEFSDPAPIRTIADEQMREARSGFDPGPRMYPRGAGDGGPYVIGSDPPAAPMPTSTTSTTAPGGGSTTSTTTNGGTGVTIIPGPGGGGGGGPPQGEDEGGPDP